MNRLKHVMTVVAAFSIFAACSKKTENTPQPQIKTDDSKTITETPTPSASEGIRLTLNGLDGSEKKGVHAHNSVFVDLSTNKQKPVVRSSWDLGFFGGADFKVIINNTTCASAKAIEATDLSKVTKKDIEGLSLGIRMKPEYVDYFDDLTGSYRKTVIPPVSANAEENKVIILNPGSGGYDISEKRRDWVKLKINRNSTGGYTVQYGSIDQTSDFKSVNIAKDPNYNFKYFSLISGSVVDGQPEKNNWDFVWGWSTHQLFDKDTKKPYPYSAYDLILINVLAGVTAAEVLNTDFSYEKITKADLGSSKIVFLSDGDAIGSKWRNLLINGKFGVRDDRFYLIKDPVGSVYKIKFISMCKEDGGSPGKPILEYMLIK